MRTAMVAAGVMVAATIIGSGVAPAAEKVATPEPGTWEYRSAMETGALPSSQSVKPATEKDGSKAAVPAIEVGGVTYRLGIDTN